MIVLKTTQNQLLSALQSVAGIVERRHTLPVLANVLLRKSGETVQLTALLRDRGALDQRTAIARPEGGDMDLLASWSD